jgi:hypothetical protein
MHLAVGPDAEWLQVDDAVLVLHEGRLELLRGTSAEAWLSLDGYRTAEAVATLLSGRHHGRPEVTREVTRSLEDWVARGLVIETVEPRGNGILVPGHVGWTAEDDGTVILLDVRSGARRCLSLTGSMIWRTVVGGASPAELEAHLLEAFPDAPEDYRREVELLLDSLVDAGLLLRSRPL